MRLSIAFSGFGGLSDTLPAVKAAEAAGLDGVWTAEHLGFHDAVVPSATYVAHTERIEIGLVGFNPAVRHPGLLAMELASLAELAPNRIRAQIGTGDPGLVAKLGKTIDRPVASTASFVRALRDSLAGREMKEEHAHFAFDGFRIAPLGPAPAIDVMAIRPRMVKLAAEVGDGISISAGASKSYIVDTVAAVEKELAATGRDRADYRITALAITAVGADLDTARGPLAPMLSMFPQETAAYLAQGAVDGDALVRAEQEGGAFAVMKHWTPDAIDQIALVSTPDGLADGLAAYAETGIDELALMFINPPEELPGLIDLVAEARPAGGGK